MIIYIYIYIYINTKTSYNHEVIYRRYCQYPVMGIAIPFSWIADPDPDPLFILLCDPFPDPDLHFVTRSFPDPDPDPKLLTRSRSQYYLYI